MSTLSPFGLINKVNNMHKIMKNEGVLINLQQITMFLISIRLQSDPANVYKDFNVYNQSNSQKWKNQFRMEVQHICDLIHKSSIIAAFKTIRQSQQKLLKQINQNYRIQQRIQIQQDLNKYLSNLYNELKQQKTIEFSCNDNLLKSTLKDLHKTDIKYRCLWKVIDGYYHRQKRSFIQLLGQDSSYFQSKQVMTLQKFSDRIIEDGSSLIKNIFTSKKQQLNKDIKYIQNLLNQIQKAEDVESILEIKKQMKQIKNFYMMKRFITNIKQMKNIENILTEINTQTKKINGNMENMLSRVTANTIIQARLKHILQAVTKQLFQYKQCSNIFAHFGLHLNKENINEFFNYWRNMAKVLKTALQQFNIPIKNSLNSQQFIQISNISNQNKQNLFKLFQYFQQLVNYIKQNIRQSTEIKNVNKMQQIDGNCIIQGLLTNQPIYYGNKKLNMTYITNNINNLKKLVQQKDRIARQLDNKLQQRQKFILMLQNRIFTQNKIIQQFKNRHPQQYNKQQKQQKQINIKNNELFQSLNDQNQIKQQNNNKQQQQQQNDQKQQQQNDQRQQQNIIDMAQNMNKIANKLYNIQQKQQNNKAQQQQTNNNNNNIVSIYRKYSNYNQSQEYDNINNYNSNSISYKYYDYDRISGLSQQNIYTQQIRQFIINQQQLNIKIKQLHQQNYINQQLIQSLNNKCHILQMEFNSKQKQMLFLLDKLKYIQQQKIQLQNTLKLSSNRLQQSHNKLQQLTNLINTNKIHQSCNTQKQENQQQKRAKQQLQQLQSKIIDLQQKITRIQLQNQQLKYKLTESQRKPTQNQQCNTQDTDKQSQMFTKQYVQLLQQNIYKRQQKIDNLQKQNKQLKQQLIQCQRKTQTIDKQSNTQDNKQIQINKQVKQQQKIDKVQNNKMQYYLYGKIFNQYSSEQDKKQKYTLIKNIQNLRGKNIARTHKIYQTDKKNKVNPHSYIDSHSNWVALFKLTDGQIVGAYSQLALNEQNNKNQAGSCALMFNVGKQLYYRLTSKKDGKTRIYQYEDHYVIIGNSEIRYNLLNYQLEHNFGNQYRYFDTGKDTGLKFYGTKQTAMDIQLFQFHYLIMQ